MRRGQSLRVSAAGLLIAISVGATALAQKPGGTLRVHALDSPPSLSMHEEVDAQSARMTMPIFNIVGAREQRSRHRKTEHLGGPEIDDQLELRWWDDLAGLSWYRNRCCRRICRSFNVLPSK